MIGYINRIAGWTDIVAVTERNLSVPTLKYQKIKGGKLVDEAVTLKGARAIDEFRAIYRMVMFEDIVTERERLICEIGAAKSKL